MDSSSASDQAKAGEDISKIIGKAHGAVRKDFIKTWTQKQVTLN